MGGLGLAGTIFGSTKAASAQTKAMQQGLAFQQQMYGQAQQQLSPFINAGKDAWSILAPMLGIGDNAGGNPLFGSLTQKFEPTVDQLAKTPGYQFILDQGLKSTQNSYAAKGLGASGAAMKGASEYATGLASNTWQQQFEDYWKQNQNIYGELMGPTQLGAGAANTGASAAMGLGTAGQNAYAGMGNAQAGMWNSIGTGVGTAAQTGMQWGVTLPMYSAMTDYYSKMAQGGGTTPGAAPAAAPGTPAVASPLWYQSGTAGGFASTPFSWRWGG